MVRNLSTFVNYTVDPLVFIFYFIVDRWRGSYGGKSDCWFPSNYVEEIDPTGGQSESVIIKTSGNF